MSSDVRREWERSLPGAPKVDVGNPGRKQQGWEKYHREESRTLPGAPSLKRGRVCAHGGSRNGGKRLGKNLRAVNGRQALPAVKEEPSQRTQPDCAQFLAPVRPVPAAKGRTVLDLSAWEPWEVAWLGPILCRSVMGLPGAYVDGVKYAAEEDVPAVLLLAGFSPADVERLLPHLHAA